MVVRYNEIGPICEAVEVRIRKPRAARDDLHRSSRRVLCTDHAVRRGRAETISDLNLPVVANVAHGLHYDLRIIVVPGDQAGVGEVALLVRWFAHSLGEHRLNRVEILEPREQPSIHIPIVVAARVAQLVTSVVPFRGGAIYISSPEAKPR